MVRDQDGDGQITTGAELFGNNTVLTNGQKAANGFAALADLDSNHDNQIDAGDSAWNSLRVWQDRDSDTLVDAGELLELSALGIQSLSTAYTVANHIDAQGNTHAQTGTYTRADGATRTVTDVWFATDNARTIATQTSDIDASLTALPDIAGFGNVRSLHQAMALDTTGALKNLVSQFAVATDAAARSALLPSLIYTWAGVQDIAPASRAASQIYGNVIGDARKLASLEAFLGESYLGTWCWGERDPNPHGPAAKILLAAFDQLTDYVNAQLMAQTQQKPLLDAIGLAWNDSQGRFELDVSALVSTLHSAYIADNLSGLRQLTELGNTLKALDTAGQDILDALRRQGDISASGFAQYLATLGDSARIGDAGDNTLYADANHDSALLGLAGRDSLYGNNKNDTLDGGAGDDYLSGGKGADTYLFGRGSGKDTINNADSDTAGTQLDTIRFSAGVAPADILVQRDHVDLILAIKGTSDELRVYSYFDPSNAGYAVDLIRFDDGTTWDSATVRAFLNAETEGNDYLDGGTANDTLDGRGGNDIVSGNGGDDFLKGGTGSDTLIGGAGSDILEGGADNDVLYGGTGANDGAGNDVYRFGRGSGQDTIRDYDYTAGNIDAIELTADVLPSEVTLTRDASHVYLAINGTTDRLTVQNYFAGDYCKIEQIRFADGTVWNAGFIQTMLSTPSAGADYLLGTTGGETIRGLGGDDQILADAGNDTLDGGADNDSLSGGSGNDTYIFRKGSGNDTISNYDTSTGRNDTLVLEGLNPSDIRLEKTGDYDLRFTILETGESTTVSYFFSGDYYKIDSVQFADGTTWNRAAMIANFGVYGSSGNDSLSAVSSIASRLYGYAGADTLNGSSQADTLDGGAGNDSLNGGAGNDTYLFRKGSGNDTINNYDTSTSRNDTLILEGLNPSDIRLEKSGSNDLRFTIIETSESITVSYFFSGDYYKIDSVLFADGTTWNRAAMIAKFGVYGTSGNDTLSAPDSAASRLYGYAGADTLNGGSQADTLDGGAGNDVLNGGNANDTLDGGADNDSLNGGAGSDTYLFRKGSGNDTISNYDTSTSRNDTLILEGLNPSDIRLEKTGSNDLRFTIIETSESITVSEFFSGDYYKIDSVLFADGTTWNRAAMIANFGVYGSSGNDSLSAVSSIASRLYGYAGADTLNGSSQADTLDGGAGNDTLNGGLGSDIYIFTEGTGQDTIYEYDTTAGNVDTLRITGKTPGDISLTRSISSNSFGTDLIVSLTGTTDKITVQNHFSGNAYKIERIQFDDGTILDSSVLDAVQILPPSSATFYGTSGSDVIDLRNAVNTTANGGPGGYYSYAYGNDTYLFGAGAGQDVISDNDATAGNVDTLKITGKAPSEVTLTRSISGSTFGYDLILALNGATDKVTVQNHFAANAYKIEKIQFDDGTIWTSAQLDAAAFVPTVASFSATAGADTIDLRNSVSTTAYGYTTSTNDSGNDMYIFAAGSGQDTIKDYGTAAGNLDTLKIIGKLPSEITLSRGVGAVSNDLILSLNGAGDKLTVQNHFLAGGAYKIERIQFDDGSVWDAFQIDNLNVDHAPVVAHAIAGQSVNEDSVFTFAVPTNTFTDIDSSDALSYRATLADGSTLPAWLSFDAATHSFSGMPTNGDVGNLHLQIIATDRAGQTVSSAFDLVVANTNDAPTLNQPILPLCVTENSHFSYTLAGNTFTDVDSGDHLNYSATLIDGSALPTWLSFDAATQTFSGTPTHSDPGNLSVSLHATDSAGLSAEAIFNLTIVSEAAINLTGSDANETLIGTAYADTLNGGEGSDTLAGGAGDDTLVVSTDQAWQPGFVAFNAGSPGQAGTGEIAAITGKTGSFDYFDGGDGVDTLRGTSGGDVIVLDDLFSPLPGAMRGRIANVEIIDGGEGDDVIDLTSNRFAYGDVTVVGGAGDDVMWTSLGNDILEGGLGNDHLAGGAGNDIYTFSRGDGHDTINDYDLMAGNDDLLQLIGLDLQELWMQRLDDALEIFALGSQGSQESRVTVEGLYEESGAHRIESVQIGEQTLSSQQVYQVVQAMAQVTLPPAAHWSTAAIELIAPVLPVVL